jgi:hypothetical protein
MKNMKAIFVHASAIILQGVVRTIAASQQRSNTSSDVWICAWTTDRVQKGIMIEIVIILGCKYESPGGKR